jgi:1-acyl-sn-glycerol-3-phosphate acyltransferase
VWSLLRSTFAWALLLTILLPLIPVLFIAPHLTRRFDPRRDGLRKLTAAWISTYAILTPLYRFRVEGRAKLPDAGPFVLVANHESGLDPLSLLLLRTPARFLVGESLFRVPLARWYFTLCQHIPVKVGDPESGRTALLRAAEALAGGSPVAIFPEGEIRPEEGMGLFRPGAFVTAQRAGVPIVPVLLEGASGAWRSGSFVVSGRHEIRVAVLDPISAADCRAASVEELTKLVRERLLAARNFPET